MSNNRSWKQAEIVRALTCAFATVKVKRSKSLLAPKQLVPQASAIGVDNVELTDVPNSPSPGKCGSEARRNIAGLTAGPQSLKVQTIVSKLEIRRR
jgi:hypothetical protein